MKKYNLVALCFCLLSAGSVLPANADCPTMNNVEARKDFMDALAQPPTSHDHKTVTFNYLDTDWSMLINQWSVVRSPDDKETKVVAIKLDQTLSKGNKCYYEQKRDTYLDGKVVHSHEESFFMTKILKGSK